MWMAYGAKNYFQPSQPFCRYSPGRAETWCQSLSRIQLFATPWTVAYQAPLSIGFPRQEYWSALPFPSPGHLPHPGIEPRPPAWQANSFPL